MKLRHVRWLRVVLAVVLGVVTSVGVAWGMYKARWAMSSSARQAFTEDENVCVAFVIDRGIGVREVTQSQLRLMQMNELSVIVQAQLSVDDYYEIQRVKEKPDELVEFTPGINNVFVTRAGLPLSCVEIREDYEFLGSILTRLGGYGRWEYTKFRFLPASPLWGGLAVNTAFYGAAWYPLLGVPGMVMARMRKRRGMCRGCGYDMRGLAVATCPECGKG